MANLRIKSLEVVDSSNISVFFSENLSEKISIENLYIESQTAGTEDPSILNVSIDGNEIKIESQPLTELSAYYLVCKSTSLIPFVSINGTAHLIEDGVANKFFFLGPQEDSSIIRENLINYLKDNLYDTSPNTNIGKYINTLSLVLSKALYDIKQSSNENYLTKTIIDEKKTRGNGPFDRLDEESAYEIIRVGKNPTDANLSMTLSVNNFPSYAVSLLESGYSEDLIKGSSDTTGIFNINTFNLNLSKQNVIKLNSLIFYYNDERVLFTYDIDKYGYQILDGKYDKLHASNYLLLENNQIKINDKVLSDPDFSLDNILKISVAYSYKDKGRIIDTSSIVVSGFFSSGREVLPPIRNTFNLKHAPIYSSTNQPGKIGDCKFIDPNTLEVLNAKHPAFKNEILFRLDAIPSRPGDYSVDYATGTVYVYGESINATGTGISPPLAIYNYKLNYKQDIDYSIDVDTYDLVALPNGSLVSTNSYIAFNYESTLAEGIDYKVNLHQEVLNEFINNNIVALNAIETQNSNITDVFRIYNQTTGEIYNPVRWFNNKIYFTYVNPPNIKEINFERASFDFISNEVLSVYDALNSSNSLYKVYEIHLLNDNIMAASEDCLGSSFNSSVSFSDISLFKEEIYFNFNDTISSNINRLSLNQYSIDYKNGIVYLCVNLGDNTSDLGTIFYKRGYVKTQNKHITSVQDIYHKTNINADKTDQVEYISFSDDLILPSVFDRADEHFYDSDSTYYTVVNNQIGFYEDSSFVNAVKSPIKYVRGIYEANDLLNNPKPINFGVSSTFSTKSITVSLVSYQEFHSVENISSQKTIVLNNSLYYSSPNISLTISVKRISDNLELWNNSGSVVLGSPLKLVLPSGTSANVGDSVSVSYSFTINNLSHVVVDYNRGEYYIDYNYLYDEILVSYEYGDNKLDFRKSNSLAVNDAYYVSYKVGALRAALLKNFGSLLNISVLNNFDILFNRERYRDGITAAFHSLGKGPTKNTLLQIAKTISHLPAELVELAFEGWILGTTSLYEQDFSYSNNLSLSQLKHSDGVLVNKDSQYISIPAVANLSLEAGTFESWIKPNWNGLDNDANLLFSIKKDGAIVNPLTVFVGANELHPNLTQGLFNLEKNKIVSGAPNKNKNGIFIYIDKDEYLMNRWFVEVIDGYNTGVNKNYQINIGTSGKFYDVKSSIIPKPSSTTITSDNKNVKFVINSLTANQGITFISDLSHYICDIGSKTNQDRLSIYKDEYGHLNLRVIDSNKNQLVISHDISDWKINDLHHISASWNIDSIVNQDELHLFVDGFEVSNIVKYGDRNSLVKAKYRKLNPESIVATINKNIVGSNDLVTVYLSNNVVSSLNFSDYGINIGDTIYIEEPIFNTNGYLITNVNGNALTLNAGMPATINNGSFTINKKTINVKTEVNLFSNINISTISYFASGTDLSLSNNSNVVNSAVNFNTLGVLPGDLISVRLNSAPTYYTINSVNTNSLVIDGYSQVSQSNVSFYIYKNNPIEMPGVRALIPSYELAKDGYGNDQVIFKNDVKANDLVLINTMGLNHRLIKNNYYVWGNQSQVFKTQMPAPINLKDVNFRVITKNKIGIGPSNSSLILGSFVSQNISPDFQPNAVANGRTLRFTIGGENTDFSTNVQITISGQAVDINTSNIINVSETLIFDKYKYLDTNYQYVYVNYFTVSAKPIDNLRNALYVDVKEKYSITIAENQALFSASNASPVPKIRFAYQMYQGSNLVGDGYNTFSDQFAFFSDLFKGQSLIVHSPNAAAGFYPILDVSEDHKSLIIGPSSSGLYPASFSNGYYEILNITNENSGSSNGYFVFEYDKLPGNPYYLLQGNYEVEYYTYTSIPFDLTGSNIYFGTDINLQNNLNGVIGEIRILSTKLTDVRVGETAPSTQRTITKDFNSVKATVKDALTLVQADFDSFPLLNTADIYLSKDKTIIKSGNVINDNFKESVVLTSNPIVLDNNGIVNSRQEGTIEFWVNPLFDTANDPKKRYYIDVSSNITENIVSSNKTTISLNNKASQIISIKYNGNNFNYAAGATISDDKTTVVLKKALPYQNTPIIVSYVQNGVNGDRISIFKDEGGYVNFEILANFESFKLRAPTYWKRNTWHRIKASYKVNSVSSFDEMHLFVDGYEYRSEVLNGSLNFNNYVNFGSSPMTINTKIKLQDTLNQVFIGCDDTLYNPGFCLMDNLRFSNIMRPIYAPFGESIDPNYSSNLDIVYPVDEDAATTLLMNYNALQEKETNFALLNNKNSTLTDFKLNVFDGFEIINNNPRSKEILESLIKNFKPANTRAFINYLD